MNKLEFRVGVELVREGLEFLNKGIDELRKDGAIEEIRRLAQEFVVARRVIARGLDKIEGAELSAETATSSSTKSLHRSRTSRSPTQIEINILKAVFEASSGNQVTSAFQIRIATDLGISQSTVSRCLDKYRTSGHVVKSRGHKFRLSEAGRELLEQSGGSGDSAV